MAKERRKLTQEAITRLNEALAQYADGLLTRGEVEDKFARVASEATADLNLARIENHGLEYCREHFFK